MQKHPIGCIHSRYLECKSKDKTDAISAGITVVCLPVITSSKISYMFLLSTVDKSLSVVSLVIER
jgi:hypothetical protein